MAVQSVFYCTKHEAIEEMNCRQDGYRVLDPIDGLLIVIEVDVVAILQPCNRDHGIVGLVIWVQGNAVDDAVSHNHQERLFN